MNRRRVKHLQKRKSFCFSADAGAFFKKTFKSAAPAITKQLTSSINAYYVNVPKVEKAEVTEQYRQDLRSIIGALRRAVNQIEAVRPATRRRLAFIGSQPSSIGAYLFGLHKGQMAPRLDALCVEAGTIEKVLEWSLRGKRGRPRDADVHHLAIVVAVVLSVNQIPVHATRASTLTATLSRVFSEVYERSPQADSLLPLAKYAAEAVRGMSANGLQQLLLLANSGTSLLNSIGWLTPASYLSTYEEPRSERPVH